MAGNIYLVGEHKDGQVKRVTLEIFAELRKQGANPVVVLCVPPGSEALAQSLGRYGVSQVALLEHPAFQTYSTEGYAHALFDFMAKNPPTAIVAGATSQGKDFLPRLAAKFGVGIATDCVTFTQSGDSFKVRRPIYAGKCSAEVSFSQSPAVFSVRPNVFPPPSETPVSTETQRVSANVGNIRARLVEVLAAGEKKVDLTEADVIISGGRALKGAENFKVLEACASVLGAAVGASRAAVDAGYAPHDMQVGQTGKTVSPKLYIACGISGAIQHLAGMRTAKVVVAINKDPEAPIFQKADYGLVGDLFEVVPRLTEELKKLKAH